MIVMGLTLGAIGFINLAMVYFDDALVVRIFNLAVGIFCLALIPYYTRMRRRK